MRLERLFPVLVLMLVACTPKGDDDDDDDDDDGSDSGFGGHDGTGGGTGGGTGEDCETEIAPRSPSAGQGNVYHREPLVLDLINGTGSETLTVEEASGTPVSGATTNDGETLTFTPDLPLTPSTTYDVAVRLCASGHAGYDFTTSELGTPTSGCSVTGGTYIVDLNSSRFVQPAGVAELLIAQIEDDFLFSATSQTSSRIEWTSGVGQGGTQDECVETTTWPQASWSDPYFHLGPQDTALSLMGLELVIDDMAFSATVLRDCSGYAGGVLTGDMDARVVAPLTEDVLGIPDPDEFCATMTGFGVTCESCGSDGQPYCIAIEVRDISADVMTGAIEDISASDVASNPDCE